MAIQKINGINISNMQKVNELWIAPRELYTHPLISDINLRAYYRLEANLNDSSGHGYTLSVGGSVPPVSDSGKFGSAISFGSSNTDSYMGIANNLGITSGAITIGCWVKLLTEIAANKYRFAVHIASVNDVMTIIQYDYNSGARRLSFGRNPWAGTFYAVHYPITMGTTNWYFLVLTFDGTYVKAYINGVYIDQIYAVGSANVVNYDAFYISRGISSPTGFTMNADIDDIFVFNRALTAAEITSIYFGEAASINGISR